MTRIVSKQIQDPTTRTLVFGYPLTTKRLFIGTSWCRSWSESRSRTWSLLFDASLLRAGDILAIGSHVSRSAIASPRSRRCFMAPRSLRSIGSIHRRMDERSVCGMDELYIYICSSGGCDFLRCMEDTKEQVNGLRIHQRGRWLPPFESPSFSRISLPGGGTHVLGLRSESPFLVNAQYHSFFASVSGSPALQPSRLLGSLGHPLKSKSHNSSEREAFCTGNRDHF